MMTKVCSKHIEKPAHIYGQCIGCELENLNSTNKQLQEENKNLKGKLNAKILLINNGWEEERYALQESEMELRQENERLKLTIQKALSTWERMEDFDDSITVIENMKVTLEQG